MTKHEYGIIIFQNAFTMSKLDDHLDLNEKVELHRALVTPSGGNSRIVQQKDTALNSICMG